MGVLGGSLPNLQPGPSGFTRRPLGPWSTCCYVGLVSLPPGRSDTTASLGGRGCPFTARDVYRNEWTGLTEPRVVQGALEGLAELGWLRPEAVQVRDGGRPTVRFHINPRLLAGRHERSRNVPLRRGSRRR
jgi:hypothetical protein